MALFDKVRNLLAPSKDSHVEFDKLIESVWWEWDNKQRPFFSIEIGGLQSVSVILSWPDSKKYELLKYLLDRMNTFLKKNSSWSFSKKPDQLYVTERSLFNFIFPDHIQPEPGQILDILRQVISQKSNYSLDRFDVVRKIVKLSGYSEKNLEYTEIQLTIFREIIHFLDDYTSNYPNKSALKLKSKLDQVFYRMDHGEEAIHPLLFIGEDDFSSFANEQYASFDNDEKKAWQNLIQKAQTASGSKPSVKYLDDSRKLINELGTEKFKNTVNAWMEFLINMKEKLVEHSYTHGNRTYTYTNYLYLSPKSTEDVKGLIWMCSNFYDARTIQNLANLAERCYKKIPGIGAIATAVGNACLFALYKSKGMDGIGQLSRLKLRVKQNSTQQIIEKYLLEAAGEKGISVQEIEDISVDDYGLQNGKRDFQFDGYSCLLEITGPGRSIQIWKNQDGKEQKSVPVQVKENQSAKLKKLKDIQKKIDQTTSNQKERIDRMFRSDRTWLMEAFFAHYFHHGLLSTLAKKIIWVFSHEGSSQSLIFWEGNWVNHNNEPVLPDPQSTIKLWHPAMSSLDEIRKWRDFLASRQIVQPLKQAYREVYLLTEAEIRTRTYSNRMAAHILKQHQYVTLAKGRHWTAKLQGFWDGGGDGEIAELKLPEHGLTAQFWTQGVEGGNQINDTGIYDYVSTDQVRFLQTEYGELVPLSDVPPVVFSEIMRDVDLFVGVASVGNDPNWLDSGGIPAYREYWNSYSFGNLSESAKGRKEILEGLVPRLKISEVAEVRGKFLVVKGKIRTYKIHLGSTNILMEPNDQYLCIVPDRSVKNHTEKLYLPFEGDAGLSIILSKAFLLADDDKIKDITITSQLKMRQ